MKWIIVCADGFRTQLIEFDSPELANKARKELQEVYSTVSNPIQIRYDPRQY